MRTRTAAAWTLCALLVGCQNDKGTSDLEARVKKLEDQNAKYAESLDFLQKVYAQQKQQQAQQQEQQEREEPADDAMFAVDIGVDLKGGQVDGPAGACVTIVEAWDFA